MIPLALSVLLIAYLAAGSPWLGKRSYNRLARERDTPRTYERLVGWWMAELWALAGLALVIVGLSPELDLARIGLVPGADLPTLAGMLVGAAVAAVLIVLLLRRSQRDVAGTTAFQAIMPRTPAERWFAMGMSVTAGVTEEIVYRGLLIGLGVHVFGLPLPVAAGLALAIFVAGHLYQGSKGMAVVTLAGLGLTLLYLRTGSLVLPIVLHVLIDVRSFLFLPAKRPPAKLPGDVDGIATVRG
ncbi:hypothetical protein Misp01_62200 [Microtetraspora sp. NBRC 13810]|uniref:CPBP family intramembrane glutamic endopeptidase n=1 Tax=Microtetraspora sp. NBRC 13810 TaxID=3030990 RepID=UPI0024A1D53C|nr:CPBP family intramembrane glutamic endopeptidase [Microtetraspora sp. NBRC 13810]GLW11092.1 hypothetical protein Misp01_62200 [Microtetraspora sp. NBRC 13810]